MTVHTVTNPGPKRRYVITSIGGRWVDPGVSGTFPMTAAQVKAAGEAGFAVTGDKPAKAEKAEKVPPPTTPPGVTTTEQPPKEGEPDVKE